MGRSNRADGRLVYDLKCKGCHKRFRLDGQQLIPTNGQLNHSYDPSPEQIKQQCEAFRSHWSESRRKAKGKMAED
jgi:hypothetical protein